MYMSLGEKIYKISITVMLFLILNEFFLSNALLSIVCAHLMNYVLNGQFYVVHRYVISDSAIEEAGLTNYFLFVEKIITIFNPADVLLIGGFCRGVVNKTSDLDMRIYHKNTLSGSIKAYLMATVLRFHGLVARFPIDVFCFSDLRFLDKIRTDEIPVNFLENDHILKAYPSSENYQLHLGKVTFTN